MTCLPHEMHILTMKSSFIFGHDVFGKPSDSDGYLRESCEMISNKYLFVFHKGSKGSIFSISTPNAREFPVQQENKNKLFAVFLRNEKSNSCKSGKITLHLLLNFHDGLVPWSPGGSVLPLSASTVAHSDTRPGIKTTQL